MKVKLGNTIIKRNEIQVRHHSKFSINPIDGKDAQVCMDEGVDVLSELGVHYWVSSGSLLGIYRDDYLIPHDTDIDVNVLMEWDSDEANKLLGNILRSFSNMGFELARSAIYKNHLMQTAFIHKDTDVIFDIYYFYKGLEDGIAFNVSAEGLIEKPLKFVQELDWVVLGGERYPTPAHLEEYLVWRFGEDWQTPKKYKKPWQEEATHLKAWQ